MDANLLRRVFWGGLLILLGSITVAMAQQPPLSAEQTRMLQEADRQVQEAVRQMRAQNGAAALQAIQRSHELRVQVLGPNHPNIAESHWNVAIILNQFGKPREAEEQLAQAVKIRRQHLGEERVETLALMFDHAISLENLGKDAEAETNFQRVLELRRKLLGNDDDATMAAVRRMGRIQHKRGNYAGALKYFEELLALEQKKFGEGIKVAETHSTIGFVQELLTDFPRAAEAYRQAIRIQSKLKGPDDPELAAYVGELGGVQSRMGNHVEARKNLDEALRIVRKAFGEKHDLIGKFQEQIGRLLLEQKDFAGARAQLEQSLEVTRAVHGENHPRMQSIYLGLARLHQELGNNPAHFAYTEKARTIERELKIPSSRIVAMAEEQLGQIFFQQKNYAEALKLYDKCLKMRQEAYGDEHPSVARTWNLIGLVHVDTKDYLQAQLAFGAALRSDEKTYGPEHPTLATVIRNIATVEDLQGDVDSARQGFDRCTRIFEMRFGAEHPTTIDSLMPLRNMEYTRGNYLAAAKVTDRMRRGAWRHMQRVLPSMTEKEQIMYLDTADRRQLNVALTIGRNQRENPEIVRMSTEWVLNGKALSDTALAERALLIRDARDPALAELLPKLLEVRKELASLAMSEIVPGLEKEREERLEKLTAEEEELSRRFIAARGETDAVYKSWCEAGEVRKAVPQESVLIDLIRFEAMEFGRSREDWKWLPGHYVAWVIPAEGQGDIQIVDLGDADRIDTHILGARKLLTEASAAGGAIQVEGEAAAAKRYDAQLQALTKLLWRPLADKLPPGVKKLIVGPDSALWLLPWSALPIGADKYLVEEFELQFVTSGRQVLSVRDAKLSTTAPVLFADPDFDLASEAARKATLAIFPNFKMTDDVRAFSAPSALGRVNRLPGTKLEAAAISPLVAKMVGNAPTTYAGSYALESVVKRVTRPKMLVLSTHGFFNAPVDEVVPKGATMEVLMAAEKRKFQNPLLRCGLLLAGCNQQQTATDDGVLTGLEIVGLDLRGTELVVLSACETGLGRVFYGEGVAGLRQAFQLAGAKSVVATLWQVPDRESAVLMVVFFAGLAEGKTPPQALRAAQLQRMEDHRERFGAAHPYYWAAWTVTQN